MSSKWFKPLFNLEAANNNSPKKNDISKKKINQQTSRSGHNFRHTATATTNINLLDQLEPKTISDLAVHTKKIAEVENWFINNVASDNKVSVLLLIGPTGAGKTATVKVLSKTMKIEITEWINPQDVNLDDIGGPGQTVRFTDFLTESSRYPSLFDTSLSTKKIILVEDFPNSLIRNPSDLEPILQKFLDKGKSSLVFICTDTKDYHSNLSQQLFPQSLRDSINMTVISFNPVSTTLINAALKRCINIVQEKYSHLYQIPTQTTIDSIVNSSMGDLRCALNSFNFASLKGSKELEIIRESALPSIGVKRKRKTKEKGTLANMCKDNAIGLLHGVGRVLYPKRIQNGDNFKFEHDPESIFNEFITLPTTFVSFLHENYLRYFGNFNDVCQASEILSCCDLLLSDWKDDDLIAHYGLYIAISGLMIVNEKSEAKWNPVKGPKYIKKKMEGVNFEERKLKSIEKTYYDIINKISDDKRFVC